jgi:hypothetical protein
LLAKIGPDVTEIIDKLAAIQGVFGLRY